MIQKNASYTISCKCGKSIKVEKELKEAESQKWVIEHSCYSTNIDTKKNVSNNSQKNYVRRKLVKYKRLYHVALRIEALIVERALQKLNKSTLEAIFPKSYVRIVGRGAFKTVYLFRSNRNEVVLKIGQKKFIDRDYQATTNARSKPGLKKHVLKYYWRTDHVLCQKFLSIEPVEAQLKEVKKKARKAGFSDFRLANMRIDKRGVLKAIDLSVSKCFRGEASGNER
jgi:hypothetical protein